VAARSGQAYGQLRLYRRERIVAWADELIGRLLLQVTAEGIRGCASPMPDVRPAADTLLGLSGIAARPATAITTPDVADRDAKGVVDESGMVDPALLERLRRWRYQKAQALAVPAFWILHNRVLEAIARRSPRTLGELEGVRGIGARKVEQFGEEIIDVIQIPSTTGNA
jgi:superfamily II DNA helicase RecQ